MSRFGEGEPAEYNNAFELWWANTDRAVAGRRGQKVLRALLSELEAMPEKRLVEGHLVKEGDVCAVGAYIVHQRCATGKPRDDVLQELAMETATCRCWHDMPTHAGGRGACATCARKVADARADAVAEKPWKWTPKPCDAFTWPEFDDGGDDEWSTVEAGREAGLTTALAWRLAYLNDEDLAGLSPEERWQRTVAWIREELVAPSAVGGTDG